MTASERDPIDCVIVGAGVAGLSAALFLGRASRPTILFDSGEPRIFAVEEVREWLGFDGMPTAEAMQRCRLDCDAAWITSKQRAASDLPSWLCEVDEAGIAKTDKVGATSRPGVWAIGTASDA